MNGFNSIAFRADRKSLAAALVSLNRIVERRNTIPILANLLFTIRPDHLMITGTDLDMALEIVLPVDSQSTGGFTLEASAFRDAVKKMKGETVRLVDLGGKAELIDESTGAKVSFTTLPVDDFPVMKPADALASFTLDQAALRGAYDVAKVAMSTEETRYYLRGIFMHSTSDEFGQPCLRFAATDGHRLARVTHALPEGADTLPDTIVPYKAASFIHKELGAKAAGLIDIRVAATKVTFQFGRMRLITKTVDGTFPDYTRVIPYQNDVKLIVDSDALASAVDTVTAVCNEKTRAVGLGIVPDQPLIVSARSVENGPAAAIVDAEATGAKGGTSTGWELPIGFNAAYLKQILATFEGDVELQLADPAAPTAFKGASRPDVLWVLMPMRTDGVITTLEAVERLNMNAFERLTAEAAERTVAVQRVLDNPDLAKLDYKQRGDVYRAAHSEFVKLIRAAVTLLAGQFGRPLARNAVKHVLAKAKGDDAAVARAMLLSHALQGGDKRTSVDWLPVDQAPPVQPITATVSPEPAGEMDLAQDPAVQDLGEDLATADQAEPVPADSAATVSDDVTPVETEPTPVESAPVEPTPVETEEPEAVAKIETVYGQVIYVLKAHLDNPSITQLPRVDKNGVYMCEPESKGGSRKRVHRDNIRREIFPRPKADQPRPRKAPAGGDAIVELQEQVAALQAAVQALQAGNPPAAAPAEPVPAAKDRSPARVRLIRAYLSLRAQRAQLQGECTRLGEALETAVAKWEETEDRLARMEKARNQARDALLDRDLASRANARALWNGAQRGGRLRSYALKLRAGRAQMRAERDEALATAGRLTVRCDALERLQAASAQLDRKPVEEDAKPVIIMPVR